MQYHWKRLRYAQCLGLTAAIPALAALGLTFGTTKPALAEFEIQESQVEKGQLEFEYRGAVHWGFPGSEKNEAGEEEGAVGEQEEGPLRQSHDFEVQYGITERWLFSTTLTADQPFDDSFALSSV